MNARISATLAALVLTLSAAVLTGCASDSTSIVARASAPGEPKPQRAPERPEIAVERAPESTASDDASRSAASIIATSVRGTPIHLWRYGHGPARVLLIGLIHGDEPEGFERFDKLWASVLASGMERAVTLHAIPSMNPDGHADRGRNNARGVDLNRNWPASNFRASRRHGPSSLSEPETMGVHEHLASFGPSVIVVFHSARSGPFVDPDGPELSSRLGQAFVDGARRSDGRWRLRPEFTNPRGSLGSFAGLDGDVPTLTIEFERGQSATSASEAATDGLLEMLAELDRQRMSR
ncbi:MAG: M14 family zinc carboxypeptidase [Planctomycetota bacterium]